MQIMDDNRPEVIEPPIDPHKAMKELLCHVHIDPDGGILNLSDWARDTSGSQYSKINAIKKEGIENILALVAAMRSVLNPFFVVCFDIGMLKAYFLNEEWFMILVENSQRIKAEIPLKECFIFDAFIELVGIAYILAITLWSAYWGWRSRNRSEDSRGSGDGMVSEHDYKYHHVANFYWQDLPLLQSFSNMRTLTYIHPNLIMKNFKHNSVIDDVSRALLEKFLKYEAAKVSDEALAQDIAMFIVQRGEGISAKDRDYKMNYANQLIDYRPSKLLTELRKCIPTNRGHLVDKRYDFGAFDKTWKFTLVWFVEGVGMGLCGLACFVIGTVSFYTKICRLAFQLEDKDQVKFVAPFFFLMLVNQVMSIISIGRLLRWRVETFIFGGNDAHMSGEEKYVMHAYLALLADKIWSSGELTYWQKLAVMLQFDDDDLQQLVVEQDDYSKASVILSIKKHMSLTGATSRPLNLLTDWMRG